MAAKNENYRRSVSVTRAVSVYPKILHPQSKILSLSNLDRQCPTLMYMVLFYSQPCDANYAGHRSVCSVFDSLRCGLEEALAIWYPAAGRLSLSPSDGKLNLWCNNKGAILAEATTETRISELGDLTQYNDFFERLVFKPDFGGNFSEMPLVVAQVTKFGCGGYSIGIGTSHSLFDGPAAYNFLSAWACSSAMMKAQKKHNNSLEMFKPVHERATLLMLGSSSTTSTNSQAPKGTDHKLASKLISNYNYHPKTGAAAIDHLLQLIKQATADDQRNFQKIGTSTTTAAGSSNDIRKGFVFKTFHLSGAFVESLKRKVLEEGGTGGFSCSSFEVVATLLWKARTKAMGLRKEKMACLQFAVDTRNKLVPPLPNGFSGNAYVLASVALSAGEVEKLGFKAIIEKIRVAKDSVNNDYVKAYMEGLLGPQASLPPLKELTLVSDWTRMPFHKIGFFNAGSAFVSPLVPPIPQVAYFMQNPDDNLAVDVRIGLPPQILDVFSSYFLAGSQQNPILK